MAFQVNHDEANSYELLPAGEYEVLIQECKLIESKNGTEYLNMPLIVRNDINQAGKDRLIFNSMFRKKNPDAKDAACDGFSAARIQSISKAAKLQNGKQYGSLDDWGADLKGKPVRVMVVHDEYNGQEKLGIKYINETKYPQVNHQWKQAAPSGGVPSAFAGATPENSDICPF